MLSFLIRSTVIWAILLLFYFSLLSKAKSPKQNRLFLWLCLVAGILIPLIPGPVAIASAHSMAALLPAPFQAANEMTHTVSHTAANAVQPGSFLTTGNIVFCIWATGVFFELSLLVKNIFQLYLLKRRSEHKHHPVADYFIHPKTSTPFSFRKMIFLPSENYADEDLTFILEHEHRHFLYRHWIDNTFLALLQTLFWFHPLFYLFKKQIKLEHEFQVDAAVATEDRFNYAALLLAQNQHPLRKILAHTFNYSPLKKRIAMMTQTKKSSAWKYASSIPLFALSLLLMSTNQNSGQRIRKGDITTFRGNTIKWEKITDTFNVRLSFNSDKTKKETRTREQITKCNNQPVAQGIDWKSNAIVNPNLEKVAENISRELRKHKKEFPKNIASIQIRHLVFDSNFNVYYYDITLIEKTGNKKGRSGFRSLYPNQKIEDIVDKILKDKKETNPYGLTLDKPFYAFNTKADFVPITFKVKLLGN